MLCNASTQHAHHTLMTHLQGMLQIHTNKHALHTLATHTHLGPLAWPIETCQEGHAHNQRAKKSASSTSHLCMSMLMYMPVPIRTPKCNTHTYTHIHAHTGGRTTNIVHLTKTHTPANGGVSMLPHGKDGMLSTFDPTQALKAMRHGLMTHRKERKKRHTPQGLHIHNKLTTRHTYTGACSSTCTCLQALSRATRTYTHIYNNPMQFACAQANHTSNNPYTCQCRVVYTLQCI